MTRQRRTGNGARVLGVFGFRVQAGEQSAAATAGAIKEVQSTLNQQGADIRVVREILQRIEAGQRSAR